MSTTKKMKYGQGSIAYKKEKNLWCARFVDGRTPDGKLHRKYLYAKTKTEVERKLKDAIAERDKTKPQHIITTSVAEYLNIWLTTVKKHELKDKD